MASIESRAPELKAIDAHAQELTTSLSADPVCVAEALAGKRFIQSEVLLIKMLRDDTPTVRAAILVEAVRKEIGLAPDKFSQFLEILSEVTCAKGVTESLRSTYQSEYNEYKSYRGGGGGGGDSLVGQPLHKRGRVWSTSHHEFVLQSQRWASSTRCE